MASSVEGKRDNTDCANPCMPAAFLGWPPVDSPRPAATVTATACAREEALDTGRMATSASTPPGSAATPPTLMARRPACPGPTTDGVAEDDRPRLIATMFTCM